MKERLGAIIKLIVAIMMLVLSFSATALAAPSASTTCGEDTDSNFLSFPTWYRGLDRKLDNTNGNCSIDIDGGEVGPLIFTIALNIIDIALRIAGILAVGFVIWGGFQYVLARGEPEKAKQALNTILKAVIGAVIAMIAAMVVIMMS